MLFGDLCDQRQAETAVFFAVQGVVALKQARQRVIRQRRACRVVQRKTGFMVALADGEGDGTAVRRFADGVVEQVGQRLLQPERVGTERDGGGLVRRVAVMDEAQGEVFLCETWLLFALLFAPEGGEVKRLFVDGFFFDARQLQQALHQAVQPRALLGDVGGEAGAVGGGQVVLQQFGAGADGGERAFQLVGEGFDVAGDVGAVFQLAPHFADGGGEAVQFGGEVEARCGRNRRVRGGVAADAVDAAPYPQGEQGDEGKRRAEVEQAALAQVVLHLLLVGGEVGTRFAEADHAEQAAISGVDGRGDVHRTLGAACAVLAAQGAQDVVPAAVIFASLRRVAVEKDGAACVGDDELLAARGFVVLVDVNVLRAGESGAQPRLPGGVTDGAVFQRRGKRGGKGVRGTQLRGDDVVEHFFVTTTHNWLLFFTNLGRVYRAKAYEIPEGGRDAKGQHVANLLAFQPDEHIAQVLAIRTYEDADYLVLATKRGLVKKTPLSLYNSPRSGGIIAINLREDEDGKPDELVSAQTIMADEDLILVSRDGQAVRFTATDDQLRSMGRSTSGVRGMKFRGDDELLSMEVPRENTDLLIVTESGYAKRTPVEEYPTKSRGTLGVRVGKLVDERGGLVGALVVRPDEDVMVITESGKLVQVNASDVRPTARNTMGVIFARPDDGDRIIAITRNSDSGDEDSDETEVEDSLEAVDAVDGAEGTDTPADEATASEGGDGTAADEN